MSADRNNQLPMTFLAFKHRTFLNKFILFQSIGGFGSDYLVGFPRPTKSIYCGGSGENNFFSYFLNIRYKMTSFMTS